MPIAGRRLDERSLPHARAILLHDDLLNAHGPIPRPGGLMAADWRARIAQGISGDDMWMDVDDFSNHRVSRGSVLKLVEKEKSRCAPADSGDAPSLIAANSCPLCAGACVLELEDGAWVDQFLRQ